MISSTHTSGHGDEYPIDFFSNQRSKGRTCKYAWYEHPDNDGDLLRNRQLCSFFQVPEKSSFSISEIVVCTIGRTHLIQSISLTSRDEKGCGCIGEGGGTTGNPSSKYLPLAIKYIGGKVVQIRFGGGGREKDGGMGGL